MHKFSGTRPKNLFLKFNNSMSTLATSLRLCAICAYKPRACKCLLRKQCPKRAWWTRRVLKPKLIFLFLWYFLSLFICAESKKRKKVQSKTNKKITKTNIFPKNKMVQKFAPYCWQTLLFKFYFGYVLSFSLLSVFKEKESTKEKEINATN